MVTGEGKKRVVNQMIPKKSVAIMLDGEILGKSDSRAEGCPKQKLTPASYGPVGRNIKYVRKPRTFSKTGQVPLCIRLCLVLWIVDRLGSAFVRHPGAFRPVRFSSVGETFDSSVANWRSSRLPLSPAIHSVLSAGAILWERTWIRPSCFEGWNQKSDPTRNNSTSMTIQTISAKGQRPLHVDDPEMTAHVRRKVPLEALSNRCANLPIMHRKGAWMTNELVDAAPINSKPYVDKQPGLNLDSTASKIYSNIHSIVDELLAAQIPHGRPAFLRTDENPRTAAFSTFGKRFGVMVDNEDMIDEGSSFYPGSIIVPAVPPDDITVRVATPLHDLYVASLRLSVFAEFAPSLQSHSQFRTRSCQAIASRRLRGAVCLIATMSRQRRSSPLDGYDAAFEPILGTAECSFHEFFGTRLGRRRPQCSVLYVTEVAVNPSARRRGIGTKLLWAVDTLARSRRVETLYLHVDVTNEGALTMYGKAGYQKVQSEDPMYREFTTSLNLHPGATKGRVHFLMYKNLSARPTWLRSDDAAVIATKEPLAGILGFEIPG